MSRSQTGSVTHTTRESQHVSGAGALEGVKTAGANTRLQRVVFRDLCFPFQQEGLCARLRRLETGRHGIAVEAGRDEAVAPKRPMWPAPRLPSQTVTATALCVGATRKSRVEHDAHFDGRQQALSPKRHLPGLQKRRCVPQWAPPHPLRCAPEVVGGVRCCCQVSGRWLRDLARLSPRWLEAGTISGDGPR
jgi:hypothetical protein